MVRFPKDKHSGGRRTFNFAPWLGQGFDEVTNACQGQIQRFLDGKNSLLSPATIAAYCDTGLADFLDYLAVWREAIGRDVTLADVDRTLIDGFLGYLADRDLKTTSQKTIYAGVKSTLTALGKAKILNIVKEGDQRTFPSNPFPGVGRKAKGQSPLPRGQRQAFTAAVKTEVMALFDEDVVITGELVAYALLVIALHTGRNTVPLTELTLSCLRSHPKRNTRFLVVYKRRGNKHSAVAVKSAPGIESTPAVRPTVVRLIERVIELTREFRSEAPAHLRERLWLYPSRQGNNMGAITCLTPDALGQSINKLVRKHNLLEPDGKPIAINCSRLRKTFINRINEILDGDLVATAAAAGNTPDVAGTSYLRPGEAAEKNWRYMGVVMTEELQKGTLGSTEKTPVAGCSDVKAGQFAPKKNGAVCMSFLNCLRCRNCVVTGDDLFKLFSLYWRVYGERNRMSRRRWAQQFAYIPRVIDRDIVADGLKKKMFTRAQVEESRARARSSPHPFWAADGLFEVLQ